MSQVSDIPVEVKPGQFVAKKSKAAAKKGPGNTQWAILKMSGIPEEDIPKFRFDSRVCGLGHLTPSPASNGDGYPHAPPRNQIGTSSHGCRASKSFKFPSTIPPSPMFSRIDAGILHSTVSLPT